MGPNEDQDLCDRARERAQGRKWHMAATTSAQWNNLHSMLEPLARILPSLTSPQQNHAPWPGSQSHSTLRTREVPHCCTGAPMCHSSLPEDTRGTNAALRTNLPLLADAGCQRGHAGKPSTTCSVRAAKGHCHRTLIPAASPQGTARTKMGGSDSGSASNCNGFASLKYRKGLLRRHLSTVTYLTPIQGKKTEILMPENSVHHQAQPSFCNRNALYSIFTFYLGLPLILSA